MSIKIVNKPSAIFFSGGNTKLNKLKHSIEKIGTVYWKLIIPNTRPNPPGPSAQGPAPYHQFRSRIDHVRKYRVSIRRKILRRVPKVSQIFMTLMNWMEARRIRYSELWAKSLFKTNLCALNKINHIFVDAKIVFSSRWTQLKQLASI